MTEDINICEADIQLIDGVLKVSSLMVAKRFGKQHKNILRLIENLEIDGEFRRLNFEPSKYLNSQGKEQPMIMMTRDGFTLVGMSLTGKGPMKFKLAYIAAFNKMEGALLSGKSMPDGVPLLDWHKARLEGKIARRTLTDILRDELIPHALSKGSKNAGKYYINYSKLMHLFLEDKDFKVPVGANLRDCLSVSDLGLFKKAEERMALWIHEEILAGTDYHDIYKKCKARMISIIELLGKVEPILPPKEPVPALPKRSLKPKGGSNDE